MVNKIKFDFSYYWSSIFHVLLLSFGVILSNYLFENDIFEEDFNSETNSVVSFEFKYILYLIIYLSLAAIIFFLIFTKFKSIEIRVLYAGVIGLSFFYLILETYDTLFYSEELDNIRKIIFIGLLIFLPIFLVRFVYIYAKGQTKITTRNAGILLSSIIMGRILALYFDTTTLIYFTAIIALFDIWNVFRGPIAKLIGKPKRVADVGVNMKLDLNEIKNICINGTPVVISQKHLTITGIGDILFFYLLLYRANIEFGLVGHFSVLFTII